MLDHTLQKFISNTCRNWFCTIIFIKKNHFGLILELDRHQNTEPLLSQIRCKVIYSGLN